MIDSRNKPWIRIDELTRQKGVSATAALPPLDNSRPYGFSEPALTAQRIARAQ
jgi:hypothetical protein